MKIFLVGGAVRDQLLGLKAVENDWLVVGADPEDMQAKGFRPVGKDFPVFLHPDSNEEYALARTERKTGKGYKGFHFYTDKNISVEEDLLRRDLTINAMAQDEHGKLIDPYGGEKDLKERVLRHVSPAFSEDPLRVLRLARFAAQFGQLGFSVAEETIELVKNISRSGELETLVAERVWQELHKALASPKPDIFFEVLRQGEALKIIFPEIDALFGIEQRPEYHPEIDCGIHLIMCLQQAARLESNTRVRFAVLCHDFGKATTPKDQLPKHIGHEQRSRKITRSFCERLRIPREFQQLAEKVAEYHLLCHIAFELRAETLLKLFKNLSAFSNEKNLDEFLLACEADARGRLGLENREYPQGNYLRAMFLAAQNIKSDEVDKQKFQGKAFGEQLDKLRISAIKAAKKSYMEKINDSN